jgi:hypothetical protein
MRAPHMRRDDVERCLGGGKDTSPWQPWLGQKNGTKNAVSPRQGAEAHSTSDRACADYRRLAGRRQRPLAGAQGAQDSPALLVQCRNTLKGIVMIPQIDHQSTASLGFSSSLTRPETRICPCPRCLCSGPHALIRARLICTNCSGAIQWRHGLRRAHV